MIYIGKKIKQKEKFEKNAKKIFRGFMSKEFPMNIKCVYEENFPRF